MNSYEPIKVLIADDDPVANEMLSQILERFGYDVYAAINGREALQILESPNAPRLVICDWEMPEIDGLGVCRTIRSLNRPWYTYIILLTSRAGSRNTVEGLEAGADDFLTKPFDPAELQVRLRTAERILNLETRDITIFMLAKLAESRDPDTGAHLERVRNYSRALAQELGARPGFEQQIDEEFIRLIYLTSPLHDIGKVAIPDAVLLKPGKFTAEDFEVMKTHTVEGARTLDAALAQHPGARFLEMARDIALSHHEKWNGSGYPYNLAGKAIPLCGRIVALADVYDALISKRVYKAAMPHERARQIIIDDRGEHFDPDVVDTFLAIEQRFLEIHQHFQEADAAETALAGINAGR